MTSEGTSKKRKSRWTISAMMAAFWSAESGCVSSPLTPTGVWALVHGAAGNAASQAVSASRKSSTSQSDTEAVPQLSAKW